MNRNRYRLVFNTTLGMMVPVAETARSQGKSGAGKAVGGCALALVGGLLGSPVWAELPVASVNYAAPGTTANYLTNGTTQAYMNQVGNKAIVNFDSFNLSAGSNVQLRQVTQLPAGFNDPAALVQGASFSTLARIHDLNPSIIAGSISQAAGQQANLILVNSNGIAFMGGSQVNLNQFTASTLNIADDFVTGSLLTNETLRAQFEKDLNGNEARGFIKVFPNAKISADSFGRVMLIAPTVINQGEVTAPDGQVIAAAGSKVFLRSASGEDANVNGLLVEVDSAAALADFDTANTAVKDGLLDGQTVALTNPAEDKLGHVTNTGTLSTPRGNVTMVGFAVNQKGIARATSSVVSNGSVYLLAKDRANSKTTSQRGGQLTLGANSLTEVTPELNDSTGAKDGKTGKPEDDQALARRSQVRGLGQVIEVESKATIHTPSGVVTLVAQDVPAEGEAGSSSPFVNAGATRISNTARLHIADDALIDVAGEQDVAVSAARNTVTIDLRGNELADSPINQSGAIRNETVFIDVEQALARSNAGQSTLVSRGVLESSQAALDRTAAERSTSGGKVILKSQGDTLVDAGATLDLSGGSVRYTAANVKTTLLSSNGKTIDASDADAETRYDGIATRFVIDYGRWNRQEVIDLGQSYRYDLGYVEGKSAGQVEVIGMKRVAFDADVQGRTVTGDRQRAGGLQPAGASFKVGSNDAADDYKLNQKIIIGSALPAEVNALALNPALFGKDKIATLEAYSNQAAEIREALRLPQGGGVAMTARNITLGADVEALGGSLSFTAKKSALDTSASGFDIVVADGVKLSTRGTWVNDLPTAPTHLSGEAHLIQGGTLALKATNSVVLGTQTELNADGGAHVQANGKVVGGKGGAISLDGERVELGDSALHAYGVGKGGNLTLKTNRIAIGHATDDPFALDLDTGFFQRGGFAQYTLTGDSRVDIADNAIIAPRVVSRELLGNATLQPTGQPLSGFSHTVLRDDRVRESASLTLASNSPGVPQDPQQGVVRLGSGAKILADDKATVRLSARNRVEILGEIDSASGTVSASVAREGSDYLASAGVWLGEAAIIDVAGQARTYTDNQGLTQGTVLKGGTVTLDAKNAYVVAKSGSQIRVSGAAPVTLGQRNENGGIGRQIGSDAGSLNVSSTESVLLESTLAAKGGSTQQRGGQLNVNLPTRSDTTLTYPTTERSLTLGNIGTTATTNLKVGDDVPDALNGVTHLGMQAIEAAGFDRVNLAAADAIVLENGLDVGANRTRPLRELGLGAARFETRGGDVTLRADALRFANPLPASSTTALTSTGSLTAHARQIEFAGDTTFSGMATASFNATEAIRLTGQGGATPNGSVKVAADAVFHAAVVAPSTATRFTVEAVGKRIEFSRNTDTPTQPLSALGSLTVKAGDIVQGGNLWAPLGQLDFQASNTLEFKDGSLTSVAAKPGSLLPHGRIENGKTWAYGAPTSDTDINDLPEKSIRTQAASIDMQPGAQIDLAGGGDLQAYEFTVGPGGSKDILADKNTYAILPGYTGGFAPVDAQEGFDRAPGEAVYLSGVPGLKDGIYTLLPAHYALLPDAFAVKLDSGLGSVLPGQAYSRQDGVRIAAGYVTDSRANAPKDANWQGIQVMTRDQVRARSEFTLTRASQFFADSRNRPQDAGLLSVSTTGSGVDALKLDATYHTAAAAGGRGAQVDISALKLAVTSGTPTGIDPDAVVLDAARLNALGADSLLIGGTRSRSGDTTTLTEVATSVTLANDADNALKGSEVMLAASDTLTLKAGSALDALGATSGDAGHYQTAGSGAFVRAASTTATFARTGNPTNSTGTLTGEVGSRITAADSITLDATRTNDFDGTTVFTRNGVAVAGNLGVGATRIHFGDAPVGSEGITYTQAELDATNLAGLSLTSYSTFNLYGNVSVGKLDGNGKPLLQNLTLQGAGLAGISNAGQTAQINAKNLTLTNPNNAATFAAGGTLGSGGLAITADTLTLGQGDKAIQGFSTVSMTANELVAASGTGKLDVNAPLTLNVARISGARGGDQSLNSTAALVVAQRTADRVLAPVTALGAKWAMQGSTVNFDSRAELPSGHFKLAATSGDVTLGANARVDVAGRAVKFFDVEKPSWGGTAEFVSDTGNVEFGQGSLVDVSAAPGGDAGTLIVNAANGTLIAANGSVRGLAPEDSNQARGEGARALIHVGALTGFSDLNTALNSGGFDGTRDLRVRTGNVSIAATDTVIAHDIRIAADGGTLDVAGTLDASGTDTGRIELWAKGDVNVKSTARLTATSSGAYEDGGDIVAGTRDGQLDLATGSVIDVSGGANGQNGTVLLRAPRINGDTDVAVTALGSSVTGARSVVVEAVKVYDNKTTLNATTTNSGTTLGLGAITADNTTFAGHHAAIRTRLNRADLDVLSGVEVRSTGDLTLGADWNLATARAGGEVGGLTLRAGGHLKLDNHLSDGFNVASPLNGTAPATLLAGDSWTYRLVGGAEAHAANPLSVVKGAGNVELAAGKLVRTGTGDIHMAAGSDIKLGSDKSAIYTAGRVADALPAGSGFTVPVNAQFSQGGGDIHLTALGDIVSTQRSRQLYSNWLFRQGRLNSTGDGYTTRPAWWVRFDQFQQGIGALGGGNVTLSAGGKVENVSASAPTQARMDSDVPDETRLVKTGGGDVRVETGGDVRGGQYYADRGDITISAGGSLGSGELVSNKPLYPILALGDSKARVRADGDANIQAIINPHLVVQASRNPGGANNNNLLASSTTLDARWSVFSTYSEPSGLDLQSLSGNVVIHENASSSANITANAGPYSSTASTSNLLNFGLSSGNYLVSEALSLLPTNLRGIAFQGDLTVDGIVTLILSPAPSAQLELLAAGSVNLRTPVVMSDTTPLSNAIRPSVTSKAFVDARSVNPAVSHAGTPVHINDAEPVRIYAVANDVEGKLNTPILTLPKAIAVKAGRDVIDLGLTVQHVNSTNNVSKIEAGRDVVFSAPSTGDRAPSAYIRIGGEGRLEMNAGRTIDLGVSAGIVSRGNLDNSALPTRGADIQLTAGTGAAGADYTGAVDRLLTSLRSGQTDETTLWLARWLTGDTTLDSANVLPAVEAVGTLNSDTQRTRVRDMLFTALQTTGREFRNQDSGFAGDYSRGYAALELLFPGIEARNPDGSFTHYEGDIDLFASRVLTERGGDIEFLTPGGQVIVGLANTTEKQLATPKPSAGAAPIDGAVLGLAVLDAGAIRGASRGDMLVNQSRILTVGGGDISLWSSEGDIDAGKGKQSASVVPPPITLVDKDGNVSLVLPGAASGSGIGALEPAGGPPCGTTRCVVDLIAPRGAINAGDAGIRAGNLNLAAQVVLGADNISVSGTSSGTPVADTSAVTAASSGASNAGGDVSSSTAALAQNLSEAARVAENLKNTFKPTFISVEVIGHGE